MQSFWNDLSAHRAAGRPGVWRRPLGASVAPADDVFAWLRAAAGRVRDHDERIAFRTYLEGRAVEFHDALAPRDGDAGTAAYLRRLDPTRGDALVAVNHLQGASPAAWRRALELTAPWAAREGVGAGGTMLDLFAGAYRVGPFGVHKDQFDVVTFVVEGRKRFLAWPFEHFAERPDVPDGAALRPVGLRHHDYARDRADAVVLEGEPGDVFFWPAEWWHVAESDHGHCTTLSLGFSREETTHRFVESAARELAAEEALDAPRALDPSRGDARHAVARALAAMRDHATDQRLARRVEEKLLAHQSALGFAVAPDPLPRDAVSLDGPLRLVAPGALAWLERGDELVWSVGGAVFRYPRAEALVRAFARVACGEAFVAADVEALADGTVSPLALRHALGTMATRHALVRVG